MDTKRELRSSQWFGTADKYGFYARSWMKNQGILPEMFDGRPVIGICNTWSELTPCNAHLRGLAEHVKKGVLAAGGLPLEFPVMSLGESLVRPTAMIYRNQVSMDVEETIRANPIDGVVLLAGCDKTTPALLMGAASVDVPAIMVSGGPMLNGRFRGRQLGSGTDVIRFDEMLHTGEMSTAEFLDAEAAMSRSAGSCMTMGTASTMASLAEAMGMALSQNAAIPAVDSRRAVLAAQSGKRIVELVKNDIRLSHILTRQALENTIIVNGGIGGSTNAVVHLLAIAGRLGIDLTLDDWDRLGKTVPCLLNLMPSGTYLMEDFYDAGGLPALMRELLPLMHGDAMTVSGHTIAQEVANAACYNQDVIRPFEDPFKARGGIAVLRGNLAPDGAVIKPSAASQELMQHRGRAVVFEDMRDFKARIDDPELDVDESCILVLKHAGPVGYPGMPEVGNMTLPNKLLRKGVRDMVRISDGRMSGTAFGTVVLHVAPESAIGGPLAFVRNGDLIELDVEAGRLHLDITDQEMVARRAEWQRPQPHYERGYGRIFIDNVMQADKGADFGVLVGSSGSAVPAKSV
ncbi:dihydroxy-acid dehydratase [Brucella pituitosa]|uniref:IlvD/Edd family dehydratase n=1 Tax=Brucella pituitosa TaxID=571256 RepID=UPI0020061960|nr:IlvD/Edd family dehydratase [Brucella pituitosa]MCK4205065.1 dihydroxy-acid dehydratase [Brucella pituitosa]